MIKAKPVVRVESKTATKSKRELGPRKAAAPKERVERVRTRTKKFKES